MDGVQEPGTDAATAAPPATPLNPDSCPGLLPSEGPHRPGCCGGSRPESVWTGSWTGIATPSAWSPTSTTWAPPSRANWPASWRSAAAPVERSPNVHGSWIVPCTRPAWLGAVVSPALGELSAVHRVVPAADLPAPLGRDRVGGPVVVVLRLHGVTGRYRDRPRARPDRRHQDSKELPHGLPPSRAAASRHLDRASLGKER